MRNLGKVGMIFNGGGLAGCYSAGFVRMLADKGIKPDYVQGISVGALTSAKLMSTNWNVDETVKLWLKIQELGPSSIFNKWDLTTTAPRMKQALFSEQRIWNMIINRLDCKAIVDSPVKYHVIANNRNRKKFTAFSNHDAENKEDPERFKKILQAATGLYGFLPSVLIDSEWYGDGMSFMLNEALKARCDTIFILMNDQFSPTQRNYGELPYYLQFISGFHDCVMQLDEREIKYARNRGYEIIENNPSGRFNDTNPFHKKIRKRIKHLMDSTADAVIGNSDVEDAFSPHRIIILTPTNLVPTLHTLSFKGPNYKTDYPGDVCLAIDQCSKPPSEEFWNKI